LYGHFAFECKWYDKHRPGIKPKLTAAAERKWPRKGNNRGVHAVISAVGTGDSKESHADITMNVDITDEHADDQSETDSRAQFDTGMQDSVVKPLTNEQRDEMTRGQQKQIDDHYKNTIAGIDNYAKGYYNLINSINEENTQSNHESNKPNSVAETDAVIHQKRKKKTKRTTQRNQLAQKHLNEKEKPNFTTNSTGNDKQPRVTITQAVQQTDAKTGVNPQTQTTNTGTSKSSKNGKSRKQKRKEKS
jgi:hypothetical protein